MPLADMDTVYVDRPPGSESKLSTFKDGFRILLLIISLVKEERPMQFFSTISMALMIIALFLGYPVFTEYLDTGLVPRFPTAILAASIVVIAVLSLVAGVILDIVTLGRREMKRLQYLNLPPAVSDYRVETVFEQQKVAGSS